MVTELSDLRTLLEECKQHSGSKDRMLTFRKFGSCIQNLIRVVYDPYQKFGVSSKNIKKYGKTHEFTQVTSDCTLLELLTSLSDTEFTGNTALQMCWNFVNSFKEFEDCIYKSFDKDLKIRVGCQMVNKAFPFLIPDFSCALGYNLSDHEKFFNDNICNFSASRKLDGVRCLFVCIDGKCKAMSRSGHEYPNSIPGLSIYLEELGKILGNQVLDGEMTVVDPTGREYFNIANSLMNVKTRIDGKRGKNAMELGEDQLFLFQAFDLLHLDTFQKIKKGSVWKDRQTRLEEFYDDLHVNSSPLAGKIHMLRQYPKDEFDNLWKKSVENRWEGLIYRKNDYYYGKKSRNMLKRKLVYEQEFEVLEVCNDDLMPPTSTTPMKVCSRFSISYKDSIVWVGSGLTWDQRVRYAVPLESDEKKRKKMESSLLGQHVTIAYTEESVVESNGKKTFSLRFPRLKSIHGKKRLK
jgi:hypothetical protein